MTDSSCVMSTSFPRTLGRYQERYLRSSKEAKSTAEQQKDKEKENKAIDTQQRLYSNVILCGGASGIKGLAEALEGRLTRLKPAAVGHVGVVVNPKERSSEHLSWGGGRIAAGVECFKEVFIRRKEWEDRGIQVLRERVCFPW
eukprot:Tamp_27956.p2 GENE.Tamp_27956~~Tamp_27956.p2  ORF type:complete len:143 (-),score=26.50 Tamp_27956:83-511(-)